MHYTYIIERLDKINIVNRGGLVYVNDKANGVFHAIKYEVRRYLRVSDIKSISSGIHAQIIKAIIESEDVQSQWCSLATDMTKEAAQDILKMIAETWITIRGFSFAVVTDYLMLIIYSFVHMLCTCAVHSLPCGKK